MCNSFGTVCEQTDSFSELKKADSFGTVMQTGSSSSVNVCVADSFSDEDESEEFGSGTLSRKSVSERFYSCTQDSEQF